jgi:hypothetical protein
MNLEARIKELDGLKINSFAYETENLWDELVNDYKLKKEDIINIELNGEDLYCKYGEIIIETKDYIYIYIGCDEYFLCTYYKKYK